MEGSEQCQHNSTHKTRWKDLKQCECGALVFKEMREGPNPWPKFIKRTLLFTTISLGTVLGMIYVRALILGLT